MGYGLRYHYLSLRETQFDKCTEYYYEKHIPIYSVITNPYPVKLPESKTFNSKVYVLGVITGTANAVAIDTSV